jgi:hypothetical protein
MILKAAVVSLKHLCNAYNKQQTKKQLNVIFFVSAAAWRLQILIKNKKTAEYQKKKTPPKYKNM